MSGVRIPEPLPFFYTPHKSQTKRNLSISPCTKSFCKIYYQYIRSHKNSNFSEIIPFGSQVLSFSVSGHKIGHQNKTSFKLLISNNLTARNVFKQNFPILRLYKCTTKFIRKSQTPDTKLSSFLENAP